MPVNLLYGVLGLDGITSKHKDKVKVSTPFMDLLGIYRGWWSDPYIRTIYQAKEQRRYSCSTAVFLAVYVEASSTDKNTVWQFLMLTYLHVLLKWVTSDYSLSPKTMSKLAYHITELNSVAATVILLPTEQHSLLLLSLLIVWGWIAQKSKTVLW